MNVYNNYHNYQLNSIELALVFYIIEGRDVLRGLFSTLCFMLTWRSDLRGALLIHFSLLVGS